MTRKSNSSYLVLLKKAFLYLLPFAVAGVFSVFIYKMYMLRVNAFGCFDDCFNIIGGYWITQGKVIYADFFFNHHPGMAVISAGIQLITNPINMYELILRHRQFVFLFGFLMYMGLISRFRWPVVGFMLLYETTKFYLFGDRFLAEGIIVYPLIYLTGLLMYQWQQKQLFLWDYVIAACCTWFVLFMREPYNPLVLCMFLLLIWGKVRERNTQWGIGIFGILTVVTVMLLPFNDFLFNVFTINSQVFRGEIQQAGIGSIVQAFFYPFSVYTGGVWNVFRISLVGVTTVFLFTMVATLIYRRNVQIILVLLVLGLANLRFTPPGYLFYEAFHMLPWYGILLFSTWMLVAGLRKRVQIIVLMVLLGLYGYFIASPDTFLRDKLNPHEEFMMQYSAYASYGEAVRLLSRNGDTLFVDGFDELIHWQAKLPSPYRYNWYTSVMPHLPVYAKARDAMFTKNPPTFYYGSCPGNKTSYQLLPETVKNSYQQLTIFEKPSCLYINKNKLPAITEEQWQRVKELGYEMSK